MRRTGLAELPLHPGHAPRWLFDRMVRLADGIVGVILYEYGQEEFLRRISDPFWFQALSCVLGFDWHSSGTTTVTCGVLKCAIDPQRQGLAITGGKGRVSRMVPKELRDLAGVFPLSTERIEGLEHASKMAAKVDNAAVQDAHQLYHHAFLVTEEGKWAVVQQGMNPEAKTARRYHWLSDHVHSFVEEPHECILGTKQKRTLDLTARESGECRAISVDLAKERPEKVGNALKAIRPAYQRSLEEWLPELGDTGSYAVKTLYMPRRINWDALRRTYEFQPSNYEELIGIGGVGPATVRALALISELAYGKPPSWRDPVKYSFAVGGKDGVPYPVDREAMDESAEMLKRGVEEAQVGKTERLKALQRLRRVIPDGI